MDKSITILSYTDVDFVWVSNHYDIHLNGICRLNGEICRFDTDYDTMVVSVFNLSLLEKIKWLSRKKLFELCVGKHWTYPQRGDGVYYKSKTSWFLQFIEKIYYKFN